MVSSPRASGSSASGEKTASSSRSAGGRNASDHRRLSPAAPPASSPPTSATGADGEEGCNGLHRAIDVGVGMGGGDEHGLELGRGDVDPGVEQVPEERAVPLGIGPLRVGI